MQITNTSQTTQRIVQNTRRSKLVSILLQRIPALRYTNDGSNPVIRARSGIAYRGPGRIFVDSCYEADSLALNEDGISFGLQLPAGARIFAFGAQAEPQPAPGYYRKTTDRSGVYSHTRFDSDSTYFDYGCAKPRISCVVSVVSKLFKC